MAPSPSAVRHPRWTLAVVCAATFMLLLDLTIVAVALSDIQADFHADLGSLQWVVDAYTLPLAGLLLTAATLGDRIGRRRMYLVGMAIFTAGSAACALAWSPLVLDVTRALQGVGAALLFGVSLPLIAAAFPEPKARAGAIGAYGATLAGATAVGPLIGGVLVDGPGWRWIFLINLPIGIAALVAGRFRLSESSVPIVRTADWPGTALLTTGLLTLLLALIRGNTDGWASVRILVLFALAVSLLVGFFVREVFARQPMLDLTLFRRVPFTGVALSGFTLNATLVAATSFLGLYVINTLGYGPFEAGLRFLPLTVASFVAAPIVARLVDRVPPRFTVGGGVLLAAVGLGLTAHLDGHSSWTALLPGFIVAGLGLGAASASMAQAALAAVEESRAGMASGTVFTMRQTGLAAGVAILGALFKHRAAGEMRDRLAAMHVPGEAAVVNAVGDGAGGRAVAGVPGSGVAGSGSALHEALVGAARAATATAIDEILVVGAIAAAVAGVFALIVVRRFPALPPLPVTVTPLRVTPMPVTPLAAAQGSPLKAAQGVTSPGAARAVPQGMPLAAAQGVAQGVASPVAARGVARLPSASVIPAPAVTVAPPSATPAAAVAPPAPVPAKPSTPALLTLMASWPPEPVRPPVSKSPTSTVPDVPAKPVPTVTPATAPAPTVAVTPPADASASPPAPPVSVVAKASGAAATVRPVSRNAVRGVARVPVAVAAPGEANQSAAN
jgi:EmrB/QacA subfamily drug resistance transporter